MNFGINALKYFLIGICLMGCTQGSEKTDFESKIKLLPPEVGVYHCAYPDFGGTEDEVTAEKISDFASLTGKKIVWAYFSDNWINGIQFPKEAVEIIHKEGVIPFVRLMPRSNFDEGKQDPQYTLQRIIDGHFDNKIIQWAKDAKNAKIPLIIEFGTEVNGDWFPWSGIWNGGAVAEAYGDPCLADGPERFRDAYRHIIDLFRAEGVTTITWVFHVDAASMKNEPWNAMKNYYPGDDYIDWIGVSVYGAQREDEPWSSFVDTLDFAYPSLSEISKEKPLAILEFGVSESPSSGDKSLWIEDALKTIEDGRYPRIKAISYWHENWRNEDGIHSLLRLDSSQEALSKYQKYIDKSFYNEDAQFSKTRE